MLTLLRVYLIHQLNFSYLNLAASDLNGAAKKPVKV
jgi:hypothetical protein